MKKLFVPNYISKELKEKFFDEPCLAYYSGNDLEDESLYTYTTFEIGTSIHRNGIEGRRMSYTISAPVYQQIISWFHKFKIKIIENPQFGWEIWISCDHHDYINNIQFIQSNDDNTDDLYHLYKSNPTLDECIIDSLKLL